MKVCSKTATRTSTDNAEAYQHLKRAAQQFVQFHRSEMNFWNDKLQSVERFLSSSFTTKTKSKTKTKSTKRSGTRLDVEQVIRDINNEVNTETGSVQGMNMRDAITLLLTASAQPMSTTELAEALYVGGIEINGKRASIRDISRSMPGVLARAVQSPDSGIYKVGPKVYTIGTKQTQK